MINFLQQIFHQLFGQDANLANIIAAFIMFSIGAALILAIDIVARDKSSTRTPQGFSFWFMLKDNKWRFMRTGLLGIVVIMGGTTLLQYFGFQIPQGLGRFMPLIAGLFSDAISSLISQKLKQGNPSGDQGTQ